MVVVVDTCSLHRLVEYYLPLDKDNQLVPLFEEKFLSRNILMTQPVYTECSYISQGIITKCLPFLNNAEFRKNLVKHDTFTPDQKILRMVTENFTIRTKFDLLSDNQKETQKAEFLKGADFSLLLCAYMKSKGMAEELFKDELRILTDESSSPNDTKYFKKIPLCCKQLKIRTINIRDYLSYITDNKIRLIIK